MANLMLTLICRSLLEIITVLQQDVKAKSCAAPSPSCCAFTECWRFTSDPRLPSVFSSWRRFLWSPWMTPISTLLHSLWNQFSLFCSYSVWVTMDTAPKWFGLHMNLFMSVTWSGLECSFFFFCAAKINIICKLSIAYMTLKCSILF